MYGVDMQIKDPLETQKKKIKLKFEWIAMIFIQTQKLCTPR